VFDIGASLAAARDARGLSLADAERLTNIRGKYLSALEANDYDALPGRTYARAFLRSYAAALGLQADTFVAEFEGVVPEPEEEAIALPPVRRRPTISPVAAGAVVVVAVTVVVVAWVGTSHPSSTPPAAASRTTTRTTVTRPATTTPATAQTTTAPVPATLVIRATRGRCWVLVRKASQSGTLVYEGTLEQGQVVRFATADLWIRFGAPSAVDVTRGGKPVAGVTGSGPVDVVA